ncbi:hypothetical protein M885DRAFT_299475 [Pelagophyceae sp. CCMP2097]|nr:hypothetical protein M885DRAFT_299475 [Pelagophyceae sp. CCMP2097]
MPGLASASESSDEDSVPNLSEDSEDEEMNRAKKESLALAKKAKADKKEKKAADAKKAEAAAAAKTAAKAAAAAPKPPAEKKAEAPETGEPPGEFDHLDLEIVTWCTARFLKFLPQRGHPECHHMARRFCDVDDDDGDTIEKCKNFLLACGSNPKKMKKPVADFGIELVKYREKIRNKRYQTQAPAVSNADALVTKEHLVASAGSGDVVRLRAAIKDALAQVSHSKKGVPPLDVRSDTSGYGDTALVSACRRDHTECARELLAQGADPNACSRDGSTPLCAASAGGYVKTVELLLMSGASVALGSSVVHSSCALFLVDENPAMRQRGMTGSPLVHALAADSVPVIELLLRWGAVPVAGNCAEFGKGRFYEMLAFCEKTMDKSRSGMVDEDVVYPQQQSQQQKKAQNDENSLPRVRFEVLGALGAVVAAPRSGVMRSLAKFEVTVTRDFERKRRYALLWRCELLLFQAGLTDVLDTRSGLNLDQLEDDDSESWLNQMPVPTVPSGKGVVLPGIHTAIKACEKCIVNCRILAGEAPASELKAKSLAAELNRLDAVRFFSDLKGLTYRDLVVYYECMALERLKNLVEKMEGVLNGTTRFKGSKVANGVVRDEMLKLSHFSMRLILDDCDHAANNEWLKSLRGRMAVAGGRLSEKVEAAQRDALAHGGYLKTLLGLTGEPDEALAQQLELTLLAGGKIRTMESTVAQQLRLAKELDRAEEAQAVKAPPPPTPLAKGFLNKKEKAEKYADVPDVPSASSEAQKAAEAARAAERAAEAARAEEAAARSRQADEASAASEAVRKEKLQKERDVEKKRQKEVKKKRDEEAAKARKLAESWVKAETAFRDLEKRPIAEQRNGREWDRIRSDLGVEATESDKEDDDDGVDVSAAELRVDDADARLPREDWEMHPDLLITGRVLKWLEKHGANVRETKAHGALAAAMLERLSAISRGDAVSRRRSTEFDLGLGGEELWSSRLGAFVVLWSRHDVDKKSQPLVWRVEKVGSREVAALEMIAHSLRRRADHVALEIAADSSSNGDDAVWLAPGTNRPLLLHVLAANAMSGGDVGAELDRIQWRPPFRLTTRESEALGHRGAPAMVLGRSGTGKTLIMAERIRRDRESEPGSRILFVARSYRLADHVAREICQSEAHQQVARAVKPKQADIAALLGGDAPAGKGKKNGGPRAAVDRSEYVLTNEELLSVLEHKVAGESEDWEPAARCDLPKFSDDFWLRGGGEARTQDRKGPKKETQPLLPNICWEQIQSHIKGSTKAALLGRPLSREEYLSSIGARRAGNLTAPERETVYSVYECYNSWLLDSMLWDDSDREVKLVQRILADGWVPSADGVVRAPADFCYCDEVQDMTQATLVLLLLCAGNRPDRLFVAGDTAQAIHEGVSFRFNDLRQAVYDLHIEIAGRSAFHKDDGPGSEAKSKLAASRHVTLTRNYRSHAGILRLANATLDLLKHSFRDALDVIEHDDGFAAGPRPLVATSERAVAILERDRHAHALLRSEPLRAARARSALDAEATKEAHASHAKRLDKGRGEHELFERLIVERNRIYTDAALTEVIEAAVDADFAATRKRREARRRAAEARDFSARLARAQALLVNANNRTCDALRLTVHVARRCELIRAAVSAHDADVAQAAGGTAPPPPPPSDADQARWAVHAAMVQLEDMKLFFKRVSHIDGAAVAHYVGLCRAEEVEIGDIPVLRWPEPGDKDQSNDWIDIGFGEVDKDVINELKEVYFNVTNDVRPLDLPGGLAPVVAPLGSYYTRLELAMPRVDKRAFNHVKLDVPAPFSGDDGDDGYKTDGRHVDDDAREQRVAEARQAKIAELLKREGANADKFHEHHAQKRKQQKQKKKKNADQADDSPGAAAAAGDLNKDLEAIHAHAKKDLDAAAYETYDICNNHEIESRTFSIAEYKGLENETIALVDFFGGATPEVAAGWKALFAAANSADETTRRSKFEEAGKCRTLERDIKLLYTALTRSRSRLIVIEQNPGAGAARGAIAWFLRQDERRGHTLAEKYARDADDDGSSKGGVLLVPDEWRSRGCLRARTAENAVTDQDRKNNLESAARAFASADDKILADRCAAQMLSIDLLRQVQARQSAGGDMTDNSKKAADAVATCISSLALHEAVLLARASKNEPLAAKLEAFLRKKTMA